MKKIYFLVLSLIFLNIFNYSYAAISDNFKMILNMMDIPTNNVDGREINEEIYNKYQLFVYGSPKDVSTNQRWKDYASGKWINEGSGVAGEYRVLGYGLSGNVVNNERFPDDYSNGSTPLEWNYIPIEDALSSWNCSDTYQSKRQYEYMTKRNLERNGVTYPITAEMIGLNKARLETYATWKTAGSIFTKKKDNVGAIWEATFHVPPMAGDATLEARLNIEGGNKFYFEPEQNVLEIGLSYGAEVKNLGEYANVEDIKKISSELEVNNNSYDKIQAEKNTEVGRTNKLIIKKEDYPNCDKILISVRNTAILETCFHAEAPMVDIKDTIIEIYFKEIEQEEIIRVKNNNKKYDNDIPRPIINYINLYRKSVAEDSLKASLLIAKKTNQQFICAGQVLVVEASVSNSPDRVVFAIEGNSSIQKLDDLTKRFVFDEPKSRNEKLVYGSVKSLEDSYKLPRSMKKENGKYYLEYIIPYKTTQTLHSWNTLREESQNAFEINKSRLFSRIGSPYKIKITARNDGGVATESVSLDVFERWDTIYNRDLSEYVK